MISFAAAASTKDDQRVSCIDLTTANASTPNNPEHFVKALPSKWASYD